jgi:hypothetical protein
VSVDETGTAYVEAVKALLVPGVQKPPPPPGRKTVPGPSRGGTEDEEGEETRGSENETRLVAARPPGHEPGGLQWRRGLPGVASAAVQALRRLTATTSSRDPTLMVKEQGPWGTEPRRGRRRAAEGVEPGCPDIPRRGGRRAARLAARWAA